MAWTKLKDIFATKKEINEVRDSLSRQYPSIDSRNLKSIYFQVYDDGSKYHFQAIVKMKNGLAKTLTLITWQ